MGLLTLHRAYRKQILPNSRKKLKKTHLSIFDPVNSGTTPDNLDNISSKTLLEKRWQYKYRSLMDTLSQFNVEDETAANGPGSAPRTPLSASNRRTYLTIQGVPRRPRSYLQLENNLRNLFDGPPPAGSPPPPAVVSDHDGSGGQQQNQHQNQSFHRSNSYNVRSRTDS